MIKRRQTAAALLVALSLVSTHASADCLSRGQGRELMERGQVIPLPEALQRAGLPPGGLVDAQLCQGGRGYVYKVRVLQGGGKVRAMNIPAS